MDYDIFSLSFMLFSGPFASYTEIAVYYQPPRILSFDPALSFIRLQATYNNSTPDCRTYI